MSKRPLNEADLTAIEQEHVRNALYFLRAKFGTWKAIGRLLHFEEGTVVQCANGTRNVSTNMAFRLARVLGIAIDALIGGRFPTPGLCPRCGYKMPVDGKFRHT